MKNGDTIPTTGELVVTTCWCGIQFAMPSDLMRWHRQSEGNSTYCPLGHAGVVRETTASKLAAAEARERHLEDQLQAAEMEAEAVRVKLIRDRQRFANGVCPCCNRSFQNVRQHMATQHPEYDPTDLSAPRYKCSCGRSFDTAQGLRIHQGRSRYGNSWVMTSTPAWRRHLTVI